jgi:hypothetical protein
MRVSLSPLGGSCFLRAQPKTTVDDASLEKPSPLGDPRSNTPVPLEFESKLPTEYQRRSAPLQYLVESVGVPFESTVAIAVGVSHLRDRTV